eukprot:455788_1
MYVLKSTAFYSKYTDGIAQLFSNTAVRLPDFPYIEGNAPRSYCFAAKFHDSVKNQCILSTGYPSKSQAFNIVLYGGTNNRIGVMGYTDDYFPTSGKANYNILRYNHYCVTFNGEIITIYVNGVFDNSQKNPSLDTKEARGQVNYIGKSNHIGYEYPFYGYIKNIRLFGKVLSQEEVKILYANDL